MKMSKGDRAKQFMPFAALRGYYDAIKDKERIIADKRELSEEELFELNQVIRQIKKGDLVTVEYYVCGGYEKISGAVSYIDTVMQKLRIVKTNVDFCDINKIEIK